MKKRSEMQSGCRADSGQYEIRWLAALRVGGEGEREEERCSSRPVEPAGGRRRQRLVVRLQHGVQKTME